MADYVKVPKEIFEPLAELVKIGLFRDEKDALVRILHEQAKNKIHYYKGKIGKMKKKYKVDFQEFKKTIEERKGEEIFEEWDDFIQWESYEKGLKYWTNIEEGIKGKVK